MYDGTGSDAENAQRAARLRLSGGVSITVGNDVYLANNSGFDVLTHELTHVWQFQALFHESLAAYGYFLVAEQAADALHRRSESFWPGNPYRLPSLPLKRPFGRHFFNSQAEMVRACYSGQSAYCAVTPFSPRSQ